MSDTNTIEWLEPWTAIGSEDQAGMERQLQMELTAGHPLYRVAVTALARRGDQDDVLFALHNHTRPLAVVHLVWHGPQSYPFPWTVFYDSYEEWVEHCMKPDHDECLRGTA